MARMPFTKSEATRLLKLFENCRVVKQVQSVQTITERIIDYKIRYIAAGLSSFVPWWFIGIVHMLECGGRFDRHLHNGDSLQRKTTHVPAGRPVLGYPPYSWESSAKDALAMQGLTRIHKWTIARSLYEFERYNGFGYRRRGIESPYLWSCSQHYTKGKYIADGRYSSTAVSKQVGAAVIMRRLAECNLLSDTAFTDVGTILQIVFAAHSKVQYAKELQIFLNQLPGIALCEDGWPGSKTSAVFYQVFGTYLQGDLRNHEE